MLKSVAGIIKETIRSTDIPARYGGEEFAIILIETPIKEARTIAERIRKKVESHKFSYKGLTIRATLSIGITSTTVTCSTRAVIGSDRESKNLKTIKGLLIERADKALYGAKHGGRNRTVVDE